MPPVRNPVRSIDAGTKTTPLQSGSKMRASAAVDP
jgi:hypothetical protein